jgi:hypothetical protein
MRGRVEIFLDLDEENYQKHVENVEKGCIFGVNEFFGGI